MYSALRTDLWASELPDVERMGGVLMWSRSDGAIVAAVVDGRCIVLDGREVGRRAVRAHRPCLHEFYGFSAGTNSS